MHRRAAEERIELLERDIARLQADVRQAEETLVGIESGLRGVHTRADAVSSLAESRIEVERAAALAPWRGDELAEARRKLEEADRQVQAGSFGAAIFFASRARRIARTLITEGSTARQTSGLRYIARPRVNLRSGPSTEAPILGTLVRSTPVHPERREGTWVLLRTPSGTLGWVHGALLAETP